MPVGLLMMPKHQLAIAAFPEASGHRLQADQRTRIVQPRFRRWLSLTHLRLRSWTFPRCAGPPPGSSKCISRVCFISQAWSCTYSSSWRKCLLSELERHLSSIQFVWAATWCIDHHLPAPWIKYSWFCLPAIYPVDWQQLSWPHQVSACNPARLLFWSGIEEDSTKPIPTSISHFESPDQELLKLQIIDLVSSKRYWLDRSFCRT